MPLALRQSTTSRSRRPRAGQHQPLLKYPPKLRTLSLPFEEEPASPRSPNSGESNHNPATPPNSGESNHNSTTPPRAGAPASAQQVLMAQLARDVARIENAGRATSTQLGKTQTLFSSGCSTLDNCLPSGGYVSGSVIEYLQNRVGSGATTLALIAAREALAKTNRFCVIVDWKQQFYPPAAASLGIDLKRLVIVRPETLSDRLWAIDQALRSPAIAAVVAQVEQLDDRAARRVQLAAEQGSGLALLVRGAAANQQPSWAEVQWMVRPLATHSNHRQLQLELLRARGSQASRALRVQINATNGRIEPAAAATAALARSLSHPPTNHRPTATTPAPRQANHPPHNRAAS